MPRRFYLSVILSATFVVADCSFASASPASPDGISATNLTPYVQLTRGGRGGGGGHRGGGGGHRGGGGGYRGGGGGHRGGAGGYHGGAGRYHGGGVHGGGVH